MYISPIETIKTEIKTQFEDDCIKAIQSYGFNVNKEELVKALNYDRKQYDKGYSDGYYMAIDDFSILMKEALNRDWVTTNIYEQIIYNRLFDKCNEISDYLISAMRYQNS